jgi:hypothetical protein
MLVKKHLLFSFLILCLFFVQSSSAQKVTLINQKGTKATVIDATIKATTFYNKVDCQKEAYKAPY